MNRVVKVKDVELSAEVGFKVGSNAARSRSTWPYVLYLVDCLVFNSVGNEKYSPRYACVIVDEVDETNNNTGYLTSMLELSNSRKGFKVPAIPEILRPFKFIAHHLGAGVLWRIWRPQFLNLHEGGNFKLRFYLPHGSNKHPPTLVHEHLRGSGYPHLTYQLRLHPRKV